MTVSPRFNETSGKLLIGKTIQIKEFAMNSNMEVSSNVPPLPEKDEKYKSDAAIAFDKRSTMFNELSIAIETLFSKYDHSPTNKPTTAPTPISPKSFSFAQQDDSIDNRIPQTRSPSVASITSCALDDVIDGYSINSALESSSSDSCTSANIPRYSFNGPEFGPINVYRPMSRVHSITSRRSSLFSHLDTIEEIPDEMSESKTSNDTDSKNTIDGNSSYRAPPPLPLGPRPRSALLRQLARRQESDQSLSSDMNLSECETPSLDRLSSSAVSSVYSSECSNSNNSSKRSSPFPIQSFGSNSIESLASSLHIITLPPKMQKSMSQYGYIKISVRHEGQIYMCLFRHSQFCRLYSSAVTNETDRTCLDDLLKTIKDKLESRGIKVPDNAKLEYIDEDGDCICMVSDVDLRVAFETSTREKLLVCLRIPSQH